ncbi:hypothetical protein OEA41_010803 [Lepraria neglecta]|uniref:Uncharacterized protein n=1 Tax=Lepraria neglecta TaxID=209136 RepID=A0AAD9YYI8_9LECA|nr:hypothetical protein OEA41_010803 [Lepraria neglecta]
MDLQASAPTQSDRQLVSTRSQLPEFSCTLKPASSFESSTTNTDDEEKTPSSIPTPEQEAAITVLKDVEEDKVIAWLTLLRSIEPGFQLRSGPGCLSSEQIDALNTLKDCHNGNVLAWLRQRQCQQTTPRTQVLRKQPVCLQTLYYVLLSCYTQELSKVKPEILNQFVWAVLSLQ